MSNDDITYYEVKHFINLPNERLIISLRQHWFVLISPIVTAIASITFTAIFTAVLHIVTNMSIPLLLAVNLTVTAIFTTFIVHNIIDWRFHIYILTNRKLLEITFIPIYSYVINEVLLRQVRTTEVDIKIRDFIHELFNCGDVEIIFDRISHEEIFIFKNIANPRMKGMNLTNELETIMQDTPVFYQPNQKYYKFSRNPVVKNRLQKI